MTRFLKKLFIPHERNNFRPHVLRRRTALFFAAIVFILEGMFLTVFFTVIPQNQFFSSILPTALVDFTNASREQNNLVALKENPLLVLAAQKKAQDMAQKGYFSHTTPDGKDPWYWLGQAGYKYDFAGENLAVNFSDSRDVVSAWMASPTHRANILANYFNEVGIASAKGIYQGKEAIFVVQFFGRPATEVASALSAGDVVLSGPGAASQKPSEKKQPLPASQPVTIVAGEQTKALRQSVKPPRDSVLSESGTTVKGEGNVGSGNNGTEERGLGDMLSIEGNVGSGTLNQAAAKTELPFWQKAASMPRNSLNVIYVVLAAIILSALVLKIFIKIRVQHPPLIFNGAVLLFILVSFLYINHLLSQIGIIF